jgi:hypothetical protein
MKKTLIIVPILLVVGIISYKYIDRAIFKSKCKKNKGIFVLQNKTNVWNGEMVCKY